MPETPSDPPKPSPDRGETERFREALYGAVEQPGDEIGPYTLVSHLGHGGFGTVWLAERRHPFVQRVALKLIKAGMDSRAVIARFEQERQTLAVMNHPNIAKVLDGGMTPSGRPYFAMEFVEGLAITRFADENRLSIEQRLGVFIQLCEAVQHAHLVGIIHRDLKPSNVLVSRGENDVPHVKVIDFGVAKALGLAAPTMGGASQEGQPIGTLEYMSPEQASPNALRIDVRTDVYSLGVILYELLTGALPFDPDLLRKSADEEMKRIIREEDPPPPTRCLVSMASLNPERIAAIERARGVRWNELVRRLGSELEWIPLMAMRKERERRYRDAIELAEDVRNYLESRPLRAGPESVAYRLRKFVRRNRPIVMSMVVVVLAGLVALASLVLSWHRISEERDRAVQALEQAEAARQVAEGERSAARIAEQAAIEARLLAESRESQLTEQIGVSALRLAFDAILSGDAVESRYQLSKAPQGRLGDRFESRLCEALLGQPVSVLQYGMEVPLGCSFHPEGSVLAIGLGSGRVDIWDRASNQRLARFPGPEQPMGTVGSVSYSPDGRRLAAGGVNLALFQVKDDGRSLGTPFFLSGKSSSFINALGFCKGGSVLATISDESIQLWNADRGMAFWESPQPEDDRGLSLACSASGELFATGSEMGALRTWRIAGEGAVLISQRQFDHRVSAVQFIGGGDALLAALSTGEVLVGRADALESMGMTLKTSAAGLLDARLSPDGRLLAACFKDRSIELWDFTARRQVRGLTLKLSQSASSLEFSPDGDVLATATANDVSLWSSAARAGATRGIEAHEGEVGAVAWSPDGETLASVPRKPFVQYWDGEMRFGLWGSTDQTVRIWDARSKKLVCEPLRGHRSEISSAAFSPTEPGLLLTGSIDQTLRLWDTRLAEPIGEPLSAHSDAVLSVAFSRDGARFASGSKDGTVTIWSRASGAPLGCLQLEPRHAMCWVSSVAFDASGSMLATGSYDGTVRLWDTRSFRQIGDPLGKHESGVTSVAFSPDGALLATGSADSSARIWDVQERRDRLGPLRAHDRGQLWVTMDHGVNGVAFSPDGTTLATCAFDSRVYLWDVRTGRLTAGPLEAHEGSVTSLAFNDQGWGLATGGRDGMLHLWTTISTREHLEHIAQLEQRGRSARASLAPEIDAAAGRFAAIRAQPRDSWSQQTVESLEDIGGGLRVVRRRLLSTAGVDPQAVLAIRIAFAEILRDVDALTIRVRRALAEKESDNVPAP